MVALSVPLAAPDFQLPLPAHAASIHSHDPLPASHTQKPYAPNILKSTHKQKSLRTKHNINHDVKPTTSFIQRPRIRWPLGCTESSKIAALRRLVPPKLRLLIAGISFFSFRSVAERSRQTDQDLRQLKAGEMAMEDACQPGMVLTRGDGILPLEYVVHHESCHPRHSSGTILQESRLPRRL